VSYDIVVVWNECSRSGTYSKALVFTLFWKEKGGGHSIRLTTWDVGSKHQEDGRLAVRVSCQQCRDDTSFGSSRTAYRCATEAAAFERGRTRIMAMVAGGRSVLKIAWGYQVEQTSGLEVIGRRSITNRFAIPTPARIGEQLPGVVRVERSSSVFVTKRTEPGRRQFPCNFHAVVTQEIERAGVSKNIKFEPGRARIRSWRVSRQPAVYQLPPLSGGRQG